MTSEQARAVLEHVGAQCRKRFFVYSVEAWPEDATKYRGYIFSDMGDLRNLADKFDKVGARMLKSGIDRIGKYVDFEAVK